jgi:AmmeMemoRadiSam system radical SAM enzyme
MPRVVSQPPADPRAAEGLRAAGWWRELEPQGARVQCELCPRGCELRPGDRGFCFVRENRGGEMFSTTYGRSTGFCIDPIEKKPLHHFYPGTPVLSFGTAGCNLGCRFCQNWTTSRAKDIESACATARPEAIAAAARHHRCTSVAFTYNDPIIWAEYAIETAQACHAAGIQTVAVTSGYVADAARADFFRHIDAANVDLKAFSEEFYRTMTGGHLQPVLDTLRYLARETNVWLEITTLLIPQANDEPDELTRMCEWIAANLGVDVPLHFSAFHPDFKLKDRGPTPLQTLIDAHALARRVGLRYVYTGNAFDPDRQHTYCPACQRMLIERAGYAIGAFHVRNAACEFCGAAVAGRFEAAPGTWGGRRQPIAIEVTP